MGTNITDLIHGRETSIEELRNKAYTVDAHNILYQFLSTIRQRDGSYLTDSKGNITSHLVGLFNRMTRLMMKDMDFIYCFDGKVPDLKHGELESRREKKEQAREKYEEAKKKGDIKEMFKYAQQSSKLTSPMVEEAKKLIDALGQCWIQSPMEGEAQAAHVVKNDDAYAVISQDADSFLFGAPRVVKNLSITGRRKRQGKQAYKEVNPEILSLEDTLEELELDREQLIVLAILVGTDFNPKGIHGIGPKTALKMLQEHGKDFDKIFEEAEWSEHFDTPWKVIMDTFLDMEVTNDYQTNFEEPDREEIMKLLVDKHDFSQSRVEDQLNELQKSRQQKGLGDFV